MDAGVEERKAAGLKAPALHLSLKNQRWTLPPWLPCLGLNVPLIYPEVQRAL